jgi:hypothetical protein
MLRHGVGAGGGHLTRSRPIDTEFRTLSLHEDVIVSTTSTMSTAKKTTAGSWELNVGFHRSGTSYTSAGFIVSISPTGCGDRHMKIVNVSVSGVASMTAKPFFSVVLFRRPERLVHAQEVSRAMLAAG